MDSGMVQLTASSKFGERFLREKHRVFPSAIGISYYFPRSAPDQHEPIIITRITEVHTQSRYYPASTVTAALNSDSRTFSFGLFET